MIDENMTKKIFVERLDFLIESGSAKGCLISNRIWYPLRKHNAIENSNPQGNFNSFKEDFKMKLLTIN